MKPMQTEQFTTWSFAHNVKASLDGTRVALQVTTPSLEANQYETDLWIYDARGLRRLTTSGKDGDFLFLKDGSILFLSSRPLPSAHSDGAGKNAEKKSKPPTSQYWRIDPEGGEAQPAFGLDLRVSRLEVLDAQRYLVLGSPAPETDVDWQEIEEIPFWFNGAGYTQNQRQELYLFQPDKEGEERLVRLTEEKESVDAFALDAARRRIAFASSTYAHKAPLTNELFLYDLEEARRTPLSQEGLSTYWVEFFDEEHLVVMAAGHERHGLNEDPHFFRVALASGEWTRHSAEDFDESPGNSVGSDARFGGGQSFALRPDGLYYVATIGGDALLRRLNSDGTATTILGTPGAVECFAHAGEDLYFIAMRDLQLPELYVQQQGEVRQLSNFSEVLSDTELAPIESFSFSSNGDTLRGYVIRPLHYEPGKKYPGLLEVHGGPKTVFGTVLHHEMQRLAAEGFFVFFTNPHGSDGHGVAFSDIRGRYGTIDYEDLMTFTDEVLTRYEDLDADRLGVLGGSYGGFMTNWIIGHTDRFRAANAQRSISNWTSFYGVSDIGYYFTPDQTDSNPWDSLEACWQQSPLKYARQVKTPTLFIHSDQDLRCPLEQGMQMFTALREQGVESRLVVFHKETHELSRSGRPKGRIKRLEEIIQWFVRHLQPEA